MARNVLGADLEFSRGRGNDLVTPRSERPRRPGGGARRSLPHPTVACTSGTYPAAITFTVHAGVSTVTVVFS